MRNVINYYWSDLTPAQQAGYWWQVRGKPLLKEKMEALKRWPLSLVMALGVIVAEFGPTLWVAFRFLHTLRHLTK